MTTPFRTTHVFLSLFLLSLLAFAGASHAADPWAKSRPNIVVFLCDDLGYGDLSCYGHPHIQTPHLDQLAEDGIRFTSFYSAAPVCSPSRVGLLTGRSPNRAGVFDWIPPARQPQANAREQVHMRSDELSIARLLKEAGYATCLSGKWHCNSQFNHPSQPQPGDFGFDHWFATQNNAAPSHHNPNNFVRNGEPAGAMEGYSCQLVVDEALHWLRDLNAQKPDQPFFLFVAFHEPHEPVASPPDLVKQYMDVAREKNEAEYFANVHNVDLAVGRVLKALQEMRKDENTLVLFTSDNGPETLRRYRGAGRSYGRATPLRGMKLWTTEAGFRVAGIMRWPGKIKSGQVSSTPVSSLDLLPTFGELAGAETPDRKLDGTVLLPAVRGEDLKRSNPLFWCYFNAINERRAAMRDGPWKMLAKLDGGELPKLTNVFDGNLDQVREVRLSDFELYHIPDDDGEARDVSRAHPAVAKRLQAAMQAAYDELLRDQRHWKRAKLKE